MSEIVPSCSKEGGNTKPPLPVKKTVNPAIKWCLTLNNYTIDEFSSICSICTDYCRYAIIAKEQGELETPHLQGYIEFKHKSRPLSVFKSTRIHWEKSKGSLLDNQVYIRKDDPNPWEFDGRVKIRTIQTLRPYQQFVLNSLTLWNPDDRTILWIYGGKNIGKSKILKKLCVEHRAVILPATKRHALSQVYKTNENTNIYCMNLTADESTYQTNEMFSIMEAIKDGMFSAAFGTECNGMCCFNDKHLIIMANEAPDWSKTCIDKNRFKIYRVIDDSFDICEENQDYEFIDDSD